MTSPRLGFIGFGEAAAAIVDGLLGEGIDEIHAFDIRPRPAMPGVIMADSMAALLADTDIVFAAVTSAVALDVAEQAAPHLEPRHIYVDINSVSPETKTEIGRVISETGARFVEAAVMTAVPPKKHKVPILLAGAAAPDLIAAMAPYHMNLEDFGPNLGSAAAVKMFRSIIVKGLEALFQESVLAADRYGVAEKVLAAVEDGYPGLDWTGLAHYLIGRTAIHGERRAHEMIEVAETLRAMGIEPLMAEAAAKRIAAGSGDDLKAKFGDTAPESFHQVMEVIRQRPSGPGKQESK